MIIRPPKEIIEYISFKNGAVSAKNNMPQDLYALFDDYKKKYESAKRHEREKLDEIIINSKERR